MPTRAYEFVRVENTPTLYRGTHRLVRVGNFEAHDGGAAMAGQISYSLEFSNCARTAMVIALWELLRGGLGYKNVNRSKGKKVARRVRKLWVVELASFLFELSSMSSDGIFGVEGLRCGYKLNGWGNWFAIQLWRGSFAPYAMYLCYCTRPSSSSV